jgi:hypothetical protein
MRISKTLKIYGALLVLAGIVSAIVQVDVGLKYANVGSSPRWVPPPHTEADAIILGIPSRLLVFAGAVVFIVGCV